MNGKLLMKKSTAIALSAVMAASAGVPAMAAGAKKAAPKTVNKYVFSKISIASQEDPEVINLSYNSKGMIQRELSNYNSSSKTYAEKILYGYNTLGLRTKKYYDSDKKLSSKKTYQYLSAGQVKSTITYDAAGKYQYKSSYTYNKKKQIVKEVYVRYASKGIPRAEWTYKYGYNSKGLLTTSKTYVNGKVNEVTKYTYDSRNHYKTVTTYSAKGKVTRKAVYSHTYSKDGYIKKTSVKITSGSYTTSVKFKYYYKKIKIAKSNKKAVSAQQREYLTSIM
jgi:hypothetical protein